MQLALGEAMLSKLETGIYVCMCAHDYMYLHCSYLYINPSHDSCTLRVYSRTYTYHILECLAGENVLQKS